MYFLMQGFPRADAFEIRSDRQTVSRARLELLGDPLVFNYHMIRAGERPRWSRNK